MYTFILQIERELNLIIIIIIENLYDYANRVSYENNKTKTNKDSNMYAKLCQNMTFCSNFIFC